MATRETTSVVGGRSGRLYVWDVRTHGCHGMTYLEAADERPTGRTFHRAPFEPFVLYLANGGDWPKELTLEVRRGRVKARWDGRAWRF